MSGTDYPTPITGDISTGRMPEPSKPTDLAEQVGFEVVDYVAKKALYLSCIYYEIIIGNTYFRDEEMKALPEGRDLSIIRHRNKDGRYELLSTEEY